MNSRSGIKVGILSDDPLQCHKLKRALINCGLDVVLACDPSRYRKANVEENTKVQLWLLSLEQEDKWSDFVDEFFEQIIAPVLVGIEDPPDLMSKEYVIWERRLYNKLLEEVDLNQSPEAKSGSSTLDYSVSSVKRLALPAKLQGKPAGGIQQIWILAASLGGPAAIKVFLDALPTGLPVGFYYAQHIDPNFSSVLSGVLGRHSSFTMKEAKHGDKIDSGEVLMVPTKQEMKIDRNGCVKFIDKPWRGPYGPSIDQTLLNLVDYYGAGCNVIFFSGMGNDGAIAAPILRQQGASVWVQTPSTCANSAMVESIIETAASDYEGSPEELAIKLVNLIGQQAAS